MSDDPGEFQSHRDQHQRAASEWSLVGPGQVKTKLPGISQIKIYSEHSSTRQLRYTSYLTRLANVKSGDRQRWANR